MSDPDVRLAKARLARKITAIMREEGLTQVQIAEKLGIDQLQVSRITRGILKDFSLDRLMELVKRLNLDVEIRIGENPEPTRSARTTVVYSDLAIAADRFGKPDRMKFDQESSSFSS